MVYDSIRPLTKSARVISDPVARVIVAIACVDTKRRFELHTLADFHHARLIAALAFQEMSNEIGA